MPDTRPVWLDTAVKNALWNTCIFCTFSPEMSINTNTWRDAQEQLVVGITSKKTFRECNGGICRQYDQVIALPGAVNEYPGIACRDGEGRWVVPRR